MHEAQMNDSRMCINSLLTSSIDKYHPGLKGATLANYVEFQDFLKDDKGKIVGAKLRDTIANQEFNVKCKVVVNCTGLHADTLRKLDNPEVEERIQGARGTHLMFKRGLLPMDSGIIIPKTKDGRLLFIINYLGHPMVGTTDEKCEVSHFIEPT
jgi:glycerol-3-phosphate dehydrogenase